MGTIIRSLTVLESGDRLTRQEFHRRYCARPDIKKAELIEGVVYVPSPVRMDDHAEPHALMILWLGTYGAGHDEVRVGDNATVILDDGNEPQPDACLIWRSPGVGGASVNPNGYIVGAPPLIVEIAASSVSYDLHDKLEVYRRHGVQEYIVWRTLDGAIDWRRLQDDRYVLIEPDAGGMIESTVFPGLRLDVPAMLAGNRRKVLTALRLRRTPRRDQTPPSSR